MIEAILLMLATPDAGASVQAYATATILPGEEIDFARFEDRDDWARTDIIVNEYLRADEDADGAMREIRVLEFQ